MKSVFYTSVTGPNNGYVHDVSDIKHPDFDFVAVHDSHHKPFPGWDSINIDDSYPYDISKYAHKQRYVRAMPHLYFSDYEYSVYLDPKWTLTPEFFQLCAEQIARRKSWLMPSHPDRENLVQEFLFPFCNGSLSLEECKKVIDYLVSQGTDFSRFFSSLTGWLIRQHNQINQEIGESWFNLLLKCYDNNARDQIVFPFAVQNRSSIEQSLSMQQLYSCGLEMNDPNSEARLRKVDWESQINELLLYLREKTGLYTKLYVKAE
ncbi:MAG: hypothetical protein DHS20C12_13420 [Pseudohongiella sp.]|nr:MAG: hypothetical protein DHS20C12_13420 [Pseudohongiella sp.]